MNRLEGSISPFLRHGAEQPVQWNPWDAEAFERARAENRPVLLDIGAVWCHWCHVMDRESYDDPALAEIINREFIAIKVDRDERPDVDARYQRAVQVLTGQGGWPLTAFLLPDGQVFYGGTYFPPIDAHGRPSFRRVLNEVARVFREEPGRASEAARGIRSRLAEVAAAETREGEPDPVMIDATLEELAASFDFRHGGFGRAPKFPNPGALDLLIDRYLDDGTDWARRVVVETLDAMARGGIHDQIGGGFHRYATDARWLIPHFEKMAYDNGALLTTLARSAAAFQLSRHAAAARGIVAHYQDVAPELVKAGGFPASQDADFGANDGDYWTWTAAELDDALEDDTQRRVARLHFGLDDPGSAMHQDPSRHVLFRARESNELAERLGMDAAAVDAVLDRVYPELKRARDKRPAPYVDETLFAGWTALVAAGHIALARYLGDEAAGRSGVTAVDRILREAWRPGRGIAHRLDDPDAPELLEDQALVAAACVDAFELTQHDRYLDNARDLAAVMLSRFRDQSGALRDTPIDADALAELGIAHLPISDAPVPAANSVAALTFLRLATLFEDAPLHDAGLAVLRAFGGSAPRLGSAAATFMKAVAWATLPVTTTVVVEADDPAGSLLRVALRSVRPRMVVRRLDPVEAPTAALPAVIRAMLNGDAPRAYVCTGNVCAPPAHDATGLADLLANFRA